MKYLKLHLTYSFTKYGTNKTEHLFVSTSEICKYCMFDEYRIHSLQKESYNLFDLLKEFNSILVCFL